MIHYHDYMEKFKELALTIVKNSDFKITLASIKLHFLELLYIIYTVRQMYATTN